MAKKRIKSPSKSKSVIVRAKKGVTRRRKSRGLSAGFSSTSIMNNLKSSAAAGLGGYAGGFLNGLMPSKIGTVGRLGLFILGGAILTSMTNSPNFSAGVVGAGVALNNPAKGLSEFADDDVLSEEPAFMSEDGTPLYLGEDGEFYAQNQ